MGTRNVTRVFYKGELKVAQYGQWDGYPTTVVPVIYDALHGDVETLKKNLEKCEFSEEPDISDDDFDAISRVSIQYLNDSNDFLGRLPLEEQIKVQMEYSHLPLETVVAYRKATRDTGVNILSLLSLDVFPDNEPIKLFECPDDKTDIMIEGVYTIDFDRNTLRCDWHGNIKVYYLDSLPSIDELEDYERC